MLSILIPIYNQDTTKLVNDLHQLGLECGKSFEIVLVDDGSKEQWKEINRPLKKLTFVKYIELPQNIGRSAIRNFLSENAQYDWFLFIDGDMGVTSPEFLRKYLAHTDGIQLVNGGRSYIVSKPDLDYLLHWEVGRNREVKSAFERNKNPYNSFLSCNFLIPKRLFESIRFDESLTQYGHEDTLFGLELKSKKVRLIHIENPLDHVDIETADEFLSKTKKGIENLADLYHKGAKIETKLLSTYLEINKLGLVGLIKPILGFIEPHLIKNLKSEHPNLRLFDLFKLKYLMDIFRKEKKLD